MATTERYTAVDDNEIRAPMLAALCVKGSEHFELMALHPDALFPGRLA
jgi:hypothetical protein